MIGIPGNQRNREPVSLRISVTDRCQFRCLYCMPPDGVPLLKHSEILRFEEMLGFVRVLNSGFGLSKVHITGGEPLLRRGITDFVAMLAAEGIGDIALTTNGLRLAGMAPGLKRAGLRRVNISLDSIDGRKFALLTRTGRLDTVLKGIGTAQRQGLSPIKLNTVVLKGYNDLEVASIADWGLRHGCQVRFIELMPIGCARAIFKKLFVPASRIRARLEKSFHLEPLDRVPGSSSRNFLARGGGPVEGILGLITPQTRPFCNGCRRLRLTSAGRLITCLAGGKGPDIKDLLRNGRPDRQRELEELVARLMYDKCARRGFSTKRIMVTVGG